MIDARARREEGILPRHAARLAAVQALYQMDVGGAGLEAVVREFREGRFKGPDADEGPGDKEDEAEARLLIGADPRHFDRVMRGVVARQAEIDRGVNVELRAGWPLERLDATVRALLRAGAFELLACPDVPKKVVLNEYVAIARSFFEGDEPGFINGVLDKVAGKWRPDSAAAAGL